MTWGVYPERVEKIHALVSALVALAISAPVIAAEDDEAVVWDHQSTYEPKPLDGIVVEAVESYPNPLGSEFGLGVGLYPFNAYYMGILFNGSYLHQISRTWGWEVANISYAYSYEKSLTTELADRFAVNPSRIDRLSFVLSSNMHRNLANGKFVFGGDHIRYFTLTAIGGLGMVKTTFKNSVSADLGFRFEVMSSKRFSWRLDVRDGMTLSGFDQIVTFVFGTGIHF